MAKAEILEVVEALGLDSKKVQSIVDEAVRRVTQQRIESRVAVIRIEVARSNRSGLAWNQNHYIHSEVSRVLKQDGRVTSVGIQVNEFLGLISSIDLMVTVV